MSRCLYIPESNVTKAFKNAVQDRKSFIRTNILKRRVAKLLNCTEADLTSGYFNVLARRHMRALGWTLNTKTMIYKKVKYGEKS